MGWISDIRNEVKRLDRSRKSLRKFGLVVGAFFLIFAGWFWFKSWGPAYVGMVGGAGFALLIAGVFVPQVLSGVYRLWMGMAFAIGWVMSRVMLIVLFYLVVVPTPYFAKTDGLGAATVPAPSGRYRLELWHPRLAAALTQEIALTDGTAIRREFTVTLKPDRRIHRGQATKSGGYR